jgi:hypothetical protein
MYHGWEMKMLGSFSQAKIVIIIEIVHWAFFDTTHKYTQFIERTG